ncbi:MAG: magnesium transporter [Cyclobacteriaceae bacterium]
MESIEIQELLAERFVARFPKDGAAILNTASVDDIITKLQNFDEITVREVLLGLTPDMVAGVIKEMSDELFTQIFTELDAYTSARLISRIQPNLLVSKLDLLPARKSKAITDLLTYPAESAGYIMDTQILTFLPDRTTGEVLQKLRQVGDRRVFTVYVADIDGKLLGSASLQAVAISEADIKLSTLTSPCPSVHLMSPQDEVVELFQQGKIISLPVVDLDEKVVGIIRNDTLISLSQKDATEDVLAMFGAGREERALSKASFAIGKRLPWLQINLVTAFLASSIVAIFEDTIAQITVLAVFLPVVAGQSGNTGSQALAVTIRGLALREIHTGHWWKVAKKEVIVGFVNGVAVALTTGVIVYFWTSSYGLGVVIGVSMVFSMVIAGFSGAVIPIVLKAVGQDPAQSSSIVLTTVTDIVGFLSFLGLATVLGSALGIV